MGEVAIDEWKDAGCITEGALSIHQQNGSGRGSGYDALFAHQRFIIVSSIICDIRNSSRLFVCLPWRLQRTVREQNDIDVRCLLRCIGRDSLGERVVQIGNFS